MRKAKLLPQFPSKGNKKMLCRKDMLKFAQQFVNEYYKKGGLKTKKTTDTYSYLPNTRPQIYVQQGPFGVSPTVARVGNVSKVIEISRVREKEWKTLKKQTMLFAILWGYEMTINKHDTFKSDSMVAKTLLKNKLVNTKEVLQIIEEITKAVPSEFNADRYSKISKLLIKK